MSVAATRGIEPLPHRHGISTGGVEPPFSTKRGEQETACPHGEAVNNKINYHENV